MLSTMEFHPGGIRNMPTASCGTALKAHPDPRWKNFGWQHWFLALGEVCVDDPHKGMAVVAIPSSCKIKELFIDHQHDNMMFP
jgi:hypothetical protein